MKYEIVGGDRGGEVIETSTSVCVGGRIILRKKIDYSCICTKDGDLCDVFTKADRSRRAYERGFFDEARALMKEHKAETEDLFVHFEEGKLKMVEESS